MKKNLLRVSERRILDRIVSYGMRAPEGVEILPAHVVLRILRGSLGMTQAQLASRAGIVQSHLAKIETGEVDPQLGTLRKIFRGLQCGMLVLPKFGKKPQVIVAERARETARKKVVRVSGSMALEKQLPAESMARELVRAEEERLKASHSSEIWE